MRMPEAAGRVRLGTNRISFSVGHEKTSELD